MQTYERSVFLTLLSKAICVILQSLHMVGMVWKVIKGDTLARIFGLK